jgi:hypothetical protein
VERADTHPGADAPTILLERLRAAADARDWEQVRALCHPDARLVLRVSDARALPVDEALDRLRADAKAGEPEPVHYYVDMLDEQAVVALGSITRDGTQKHLCWLVTFVDGLVYRQALFSSLSGAQAAYAELGLDLGTPGVARDARVSPPA